jgi:hypothetical protein
VFAAKWGAWLCVLNTCMAQQLASPAKQHGVAVVLMNQVRCCVCCQVEQAVGTAMCSGFFLDNSWRHLPNSTGLLWS